jgi:uncharacterized membrane protein YfcA
MDVVPHKFTRPVRCDRIDTIDGAIIGYWGVLVIAGMLIGTCLGSILHGTLSTQVLYGALIFSCYLVAFFASCLLSKKYIVDSDEVARNERNLAIHRILAGPVPLILVPLLIGAVVFLIAR